MSHVHAPSSLIKLFVPQQAINAVNKRTKKKGHYRAFDNDGSEVLALKITWQDTRDSELAEAFQAINWHVAKKAQNQGRYQFVPGVDWPERPASKRCGSKLEKEATAALNALIALRKKQAAYNA